MQMALKSHKAVCNNNVIHGFQRRHFFLETKAVKLEKNGIM